ncbi:hypothetical protein CC86DRAFT_94795 [Ophiobolus disseminans]|uniref:Uncharacterized protein n=1 Tax=Ophiobolus disseminans TaxID=1469910 RepID=A0A6A6ZP36_9PLEO|nr:hypothetical protein CC86DRAFT_94795 [Ophiobolus disseminans]
MVGFGHTNTTLECMQDLNTAMLSPATKCIACINAGIILLLCRVTTWVVWSLRGVVRSYGLHSHLRPNTTTKQHSTFSRSSTSGIEGAM